MYDLRISPFFTVNGRLRPCMFDLGDYDAHRQTQLEKTQSIILSFCLYSMALITQFDDLPDLVMVIIDLFSYLTSIDVLWAFANFNHRLRKLVHERGFFCHINLSSARLSKFNTLLTLIPLNHSSSIWKHRLFKFHVDLIYLH